MVEVCDPTGEPEVHPTPASGGNLGRRDFPGSVSLRDEQESGRARATAVQTEGAPYTRERPENMTRSGRNWAGGRGGSWRFHQAQLVRAGGGGLHIYPVKVGELFKMLNKAVEQSGFHLGQRGTQSQRQERRLPGCCSDENER